MKRTLIIHLLLCSILLSLCGCGKSKQQEVSTNVSNPFVTCDSIQEGITVSGIPITIPEALGDFKLDTITAKKDELLQLYYVAGEYNLFIRKGYFSLDNSGDYTKYDEERDYVINGIDVKFGIDDNLIYNAVWENGEYAYLLRTSVGLTEDSFARLIVQME